MPSIFLLAADAVFEVMFNEVWDPLYGTDDWSPLRPPISRDVRDGLGEIFGVDEYVMLQVVDWVSIVF